MWHHVDEQGQPPESVREDLFFSHALSPSLLLPNRLCHDRSSRTRLKRDRADELVRRHVEARRQRRVANDVVQQEKHGGRVRRLQARACRRCRVARKVGKKWAEE